MRWLTRSTAAAAAAAAAVLLTNQVNAACVTDSTNSQGTPDSDALTLFVLSSTLSGNFQNEYNTLGLSSPFPGAATDGLTGADNLCTAFAAISSSATASYNRNSAGGTVQFNALLSTSTVDAIDRFNGVTASKNIQNTRNTCLAANLADLFTASGGGGYLFDDDLFDESNQDVGTNAFLWTGTGIFSSNAGTRTAEKVGGRYHDAGSVTYNPLTTFCNDWISASSANSGATGITNAAQGQNSWIQQAAVRQSCSSGYRLICISAQPFQGPTQPPGGSGDPQFTGLQGQSFQVHGMPEEYFNLITTPTFQLNSRFTYLASGECHYNNTECWTHPGTYVDQLGFMFPGIQIKTVAGSHRKGLRVWINDEEMNKSSGKIVMTTTTTGSMNATAAVATSNNSSISGEISVSHPHHDVLIVSCSLFTIEVTNSDWFFNFNLMFHSPEILEAGRMMHYIGDARSGSTHSNKVYPTYPLHGLVGQTWKNARYPAKRMYQGEIDDYMLLDHTLFSTQFMFNLYAY